MKTKRIPYNPMGIEDKVEEVVNEEPIVIPYTTDSPWTFWTEMQDSEYRTTITYTSSSDTYNAIN